MTDKIIIAVATAGGWGTRSKNPVPPDAIANDVIQCAAKGAAVSNGLPKKELDFGGPPTYQ